MYRKYIKRPIDTAVALSLLVALLPVSLITALLIKLDSKGPAVLKQSRTGLNGTVFKMYKFRTMTYDNDVNDATKANQLTTVGKFVRALSLDEIPQFMNIVKGEMSLIGPRPWIPEYFEHMTDEQRKRASVRPGITGLAQARGRNNLSVFDKINYDLLYIENISFINDLKLMVHTLLTMFEKTGSAIEKSGIHFEIESLSLQPRLAFAGSGDTFYSELPKQNTATNRVSRPRSASNIEEPAKKVLFTATVDSHIKAFHLPYLKYFKDSGYEVHVATNGSEEIDYTDVKHTVPFVRSPLKADNIKAITGLKKIIEKGEYDIIHTHTPMGSVVTRLAAKMSRTQKRSRVIYTAHGFHFFKDAPKLNWAVFYPIEKMLANSTDTLITINNEDYEHAKQNFNTSVHYVSGVGIDPKKFNFKFTEADKTKLRKSLGLKKTDFVLIYPAELSKRKNQTMLIDVMQQLVAEYPNIHLLLPGKDSLDGLHAKLVKAKQLENNIHFLGFRTDIPKLMKISDLAVSAAVQEGLPVNIMEALQVGIPVVATNCRGNRDLVVNGENGYIVPVNDPAAMRKYIVSLASDASLRKKLSTGAKKSVKPYLLTTVMADMKAIYEEA